MPEGARAKKRGVVAIRRTVESLTREWRFKRRLPKDLGHAPLWVSAAGGLRYLFKRMRSIDPELLGLAREVVRPGDVVWDIGANVGLFAVAAAILAGARGRVIACEPDEWLVALLRRSANDQDRAAAPITIVSAAVAKELGLRGFCIAKRSRATNFLTGYGSSQTGGVAEERCVIAVPLDWLAAQLPPPNVLKIDVEGAELEVLQGAANLLTTSRPIVVCEVTETGSREVAALLKSHGYVLFDGSKPSHERDQLDLAPWSTLAVPREILDTDGLAGRRP
jgi:FkbM family methyltransferase